MDTPPRAPLSRGQARLARALLALLLASPCAVPRGAQAQPVTQDAARAELTQRAASERSEARQRRALEELRRRAPEATGDFEQASAAWDHDDMQAASEAFRRVNQAVAAFGPSLRGECAAELQLRGRAGAEGLCRAAFAADGSARSAAMLALVLLSPAGDKRPSPSEVGEAMQLSEKAASLDPNDELALLAGCEAALEKGDLTLSFRCTRSLEPVAPPAAMARYLVRHGAAMLTSGEGKPPSAQATREVRALAARAAALAPTEIGPAALQCALASVDQDAALLEVCSSKLAALTPADPRVQLYVVQKALLRDDFGEAESALGRARDLGLAKGPADRIAETISDAKSRGYWWPLALRVTLGWLGVLLLLLVTGMGLSQLTLRSAARPPRPMAGERAGAEATLRKVYAAMLWVTCLFYYASVPLVLLSVVAAAIGVCYAFLLLGRIPVGLFVSLPLLVLATVASVFKSLLVNVDQESPGTRLDLGEHPRLRELLEQVAARVGTRPVDAVYLTPDTTLGVTERGGLGAQLRGKTERCLVLGAGVLKGMKLGPLRAVLAHEYGHFSNRDTAGGSFALSVRRSLLKMGRGLAESGAARWYNPAWGFFQVFSRVFERVSQGASRLQEILADRWAAGLYGPDAFEAGLRHVIERTIRFDAHLGATVKQVLEQKRPLRNLYAFRPASKLSGPEVREKLEEQIRREPSPYDSHPSPAARFVWVHALGVAPAAAQPDDGEPAWGLFDDRGDIERRMTDEIRARVEARFGVRFSYAQDDDGPEAPGEAS